MSPCFWYDKLSDSARDVHQFTALDLGATGCLFPSVIRISSSILSLRPMTVKAAIVAEDFNPVEQCVVSQTYRRAARCDSCERTNRSNEAKCGRGSATCTLREPIRA